MSGLAVPIRVAQVVGYMNGGGVEQVVMNYYRHIDRSRVQFDFLVNEGSTLVPSEEIESLGGRVFTVPSYQRVFAYQRELARLFREQRWRIVHSHINALSVFPLRAAKRVGVPIRIAHSHSTSGGHDPVRNMIKEVLRRLANAYPTHRAACTEHASKWLFGDGENVRIIPNAIDLGSFWFDLDRRVRARRALNFLEDQFVIGHVGRFTPQKNQALLIRAFSKVAPSLPGSRLVLVGEGYQRREAESLASSICPPGSVVFLGQRDDVSDLYQAFDVFCLPSVFEGLGMVAVEAEASGLQCVLSDAVPNDADPTGSAVFFPSNNESALIETLLSVKPNTRLRVNADAFCRYDISSAAPLLESWYVRLIQNDGRQ